jgi:hypothetical protein
MSESRKAMATWVGVLARGGILKSPTEEKGVFVAIEVVGEDRLSQLRSWVKRQEPDVREREKRAAVEVCIWMAHADRNLDPQEAALLEQVIRSSELSQEAVDELLLSLKDPPPLKGIAERLTQPVLRELMLALAWELALVDGIVDLREEECHAGLAGDLGIPTIRASAIRAAVVGRMTGPPT